jgi:hypothetical protein
MRDNVLRVSLRGPAQRKRRIITGLAIGAGAGAIIGFATTSGDDEGFEIVSDEAVTFFTYRYRRMSGHLNWSEHAQV